MLATDRIWDSGICVWQHQAVQFYSGGMPRNARRTRRVAQIEAQRASAQSASAVWQSCQGQI
eukprot:15467316-Alexandrium_andersonii.AAC.1